MAVLGLGLPLVLLLAGLALMVLEALSPGAHLIVLGVALFVAGLLGTFVAPLATPIALAGTTLVAGVLALYVYRELDFYGGDGPGETPQGSDSLRGETGHVVERVTEYEGRIKIDGAGFNPYYQARSVEGEIPEGEAVLVLDPGGGNVLEVTAMADVEEDSIDRELRRDAARSDGESAGDASADSDREADGGALEDESEREDA